MPRNKHCCFGDCNRDNRPGRPGYRPDARFFPFPKPCQEYRYCISEWSPAEEELHIKNCKLCKFCQTWMVSCKRNDAKFQSLRGVTSSTYICSDHFDDGYPTTHSVPISRKPDVLNVNRCGRTGRIPFVDDPLPTDTGSDLGPTLNLESCYPPIVKVENGLEVPESLMDEMMDPLASDDCSYQRTSGNLANGDELTTPNYEAESLDGICVIEPDPLAGTPSESNIDDEHNYAVKFTFNLTCPILKRQRPVNTELSRKIAKALNTNGSRTGCN